MPSFDTRNGKVPENLGTVKQAGLFSNTEVETPAPINPERQRVSQTDTEIAQNFAKNTNFFNPLSIIQGIEGMAKDKAQQVKNTNAALSNAQGFMDDTRAISNRTTQTIVSDAKATAERARQGSAELRAQLEASRKSGEDRANRLKEIEARQSSMTPQQRTQDLLARSENIGKQTAQTIKSGNETLANVNTQRANLIAKGQLGTDTNTLLAANRQLNQRGIYTSQAGKDLAKSRQELGIISVSQGNLGPSRLQDLNRSGTPKLMTGQEVAAAAPRLNQFMQRNREITQGVRNRTREYFQRNNPSMMPKSLRSPSSAPSTPLFREGVENYKNQLNEAVGAKAAQKAAEAVRYLTGPGGFVPKIVDPIFDVVKWAAKKVGIRGPKTGKAIRRTNQAARAVGRVAPFAAGAGLLYKASGPAAEIAFPSPGGGYSPGGAGGIGSPGGRGFSSTAGFAGLGRTNASDRRSQKHQEFMGQVAAAKAARDERDVLIKTHMANTGSDRRAAIAELEKSADFNRLSNAGKKFQSGSTTRVVSTGPTSARDESAATKQGRLAQRVGDLAFRPPRNQDEKDRLIRAQQDLDAAYTEAEKQGKMIGYEDQGSLYSGLNKRGIMSPGGGTPITNGKKK